MPTRRASQASRLPYLWLCLSATLASSIARATEPSADGSDGIDGTIVRIEGDLAYIDSNHAAGLFPGQVLVVLRTIAARHPVTGKDLIDHFPVGSLALERVGQVLSVGKLERKIVAAVKVGDVVKVESALPRPIGTRGAASRGPLPGTPPASGERARATATHEPPRAPAARAAPPETDERRQLDDLFQAMLGQPIPDRIAILERHTEAHPGSPFAPVLERELGRFRLIEAALAKAERVESDAARLAGATGAQPQSARRVGPVAVGSLPLAVYERDPVEAAIYTTDASHVASAYLFVRRPADLTFRQIALRPDGDGYYRGAAPSDAVSPPGLDAFIEVVDTGGQSETLMGSSATPSRITVAALPVAGALDGPGHSSVRGMFEYVDFNRFRGNDYYMLAEADFLYRFGRALYSVSTGVGMLSGRGGPTVVLDGSDARYSGGKTVGLNYGYLEGEFRIHRLFSMAGRLLGGQAVRGFGGGGELKMRIGNELGTNLVIGGSVLSDIGALGQLKLEWDVIRGWPMSASVIVSNQPAWADVGVRLVYQLGWRARPWIQPTVRVGYDVRNIEHGGLSLGLGLVLSW